MLLPLAFLDTAHYVPGTFKGVRVFAETPHHVLQIVGSDDGVTWWYLTGDCHGPGTPARAADRFSLSRSDSLTRAVTVGRNRSGILME